MTAIVTLPPILDLTGADPLKSELLEGLGRGEGVEIDAGQVQRISSPCLQVLAAAVRSGAAITQASNAFGEIVQALDLTQALGLKAIADV